MSGLTPCNRCTLNSIRAPARASGKKVTLKPGKDGGTDCLVHPCGVEPSREEHFVAWFMELTPGCAC